MREGPSFNAPSVDRIAYGSYSLLSLSPARDLFFHSRNWIFHWNIKICCSTTFSLLALNAHATKCTTTISFHLIWLEHSRAGSEPAILFFSLRPPEKQFFVFVPSPFLVKRGRRQRNEREKNNFEIHVSIYNEMPSRLHDASRLIKNVLRNWITICRTQLRYGSAR